MGDIVARDASEGKLESKTTILRKVVAARCAENPDSKLARFQDDVSPLLVNLQKQRQHPDVESAYARVALVLDGKVLPTSYVIELLEGLDHMLSNPANKDIAAELQDIVARDASEGKLEAKTTILRKVV